MRIRNPLNLIRSLWGHGVTAPDSEEVKKKIVQQVLDECLDGLDLASISPKQGQSSVVGSMESNVVDCILAAPCPNLFTQVVVLQPGQRTPLLPQGSSDQVDLSTGFSQKEIARNVKALQIAKQYIPSLQEMLSNPNFRVLLRKHKRPFNLMMSEAGPNQDLFGFTDANGFTRIIVAQENRSKVTFSMVIKERLYAEKRFAEFLATFLHECFHIDRYLRFLPAILSNTYNESSLTNEIEVSRNDVRTLQRILKDERKLLRNLSTRSFGRLPGIIKSRAQRLDHLQDTSLLRALQH